VEVSEVVRRAPAIALRDHVLPYWGWEERTEGPVRRRECPSGHVHVILQFGTTIDTLEPVRRTHGSFVAGLHESPAYTEHDGDSHGIEINLTPPAANRLLGLPMDTVTGEIPAAEDLLGPGASRFVDRLWNEESWERRFELLDVALSERLADGPQPSPGLEWAWRRLVATQGRVPVAALAAELGWSRRRLVMRFREHVGLPPKRYARILRFQHALELLIRNGSRLADVALECGYYDQAHMNRDFRLFAGVTPTEWLAARSGDGFGVAA